MEIPEVYLPNRVEFFLRNVPVRAYRTRDNHDKLLSAIKTTIEHLINMPKVRKIGIGIYKDFLSESEKVYILVLMDESILHSDIVVEDVALWEQSVTTVKNFYEGLPLEKLYALAKKQYIETLYKEKVPSQLLKTVGETTGVPNINAYINLLFTFEEAKFGDAPFIEDWSVIYDADVDTKDTPPLPYDVYEKLISKEITVKVPLPDAGIRVKFTTRLIKNLERDGVGIEKITLENDVLHLSLSGQDKSQAGEALKKTLRELHLKNPPFEVEFHFIKARKK